MTRARLIPAAWILLALLLALAWLPLEHVGQFGVRNSDNATPVLQASAVLHGNWTLRGWILPQDTFLTTEVPFFIPAVAIHGIAVDLIYAVPTAVYLAVVLLAGWTAARGFGPAAGLAGALAAAALLVAVPALWGYAVLASGIAHVGAIWAPLIAFNLVAGGGRAILRAAVAGCLLALTALGDPLVLVTGAAPLLVAGVFELARRRGGTPVIAGVVGVAGFELGEKALQGLGGLQLLQVPINLVLQHPRSHLEQALANANGLLLPYGAGGPAATASAVIFWVLVAAAVAIGLFRAVRRTEPDARLDLLLPLAAAAGFLAYAATDRSSIPLTARYLVPAAVMATVMVARACAAAVERGWPPALAALALVGLVVGVRLWGLSTLLPVTPGAASAVGPVEAYLLAHGHHRGYAPYWDANYSTVESGGRLQVRALQAQGGRLEPFRWSVDRAWFDTASAARGADFVFYKDAATASESDTAGDFGIYLATASSTFGPPAQEVHVAGYTVLIWDHDISGSVHL